MALSKKHQEFVNQYFLCNMNQTEAYLKVYPKSSYDAARAHAARLVANGNIQAEIKSRINEMTMSADEVLLRLADMGRSDIADFARIQEPVDLEDKALEGKTHVVKKFKRSVVKGRDGTEYINTELELYDAQTALQLIGKHHGLFVDQHKLTVEVERELEKALDLLQSKVDSETYARIVGILAGDEESSPEAAGNDQPGETTE